MKRRLSILLCCIFLLCIGAAATRVPAYILRQRAGEICWYDVAADCWYPTGYPTDAVGGDADRALLEQGLPLYSRTELTRALEDFCS